MGGMFSFAFLLVIFLLSIAYGAFFGFCFYQCYVKRRQAHHERDILRLRRPEAAARLYARGPPNNITGLDPSVIASLPPTFVFERKKDKSQNDGDEDSSVIECCICLNNLENQETARLLPNCMHVFHAACIDTWLASHPTCPVCRTTAQPQIEPLPREGPIGLALPAPRFAPTAPPVVESGAEDTPDPGAPESSGSISRLSSFRRMLSLETSSRRIQPRPPRPSSAFSYSSDFDNIL